MIKNLDDNKLFYRMRFPYMALQTITRNVLVVDSMKLIGDPYFFRDIRMVRLQRQVNDIQCKYILEFLKPLSQQLGFWLVYEVDDVIKYEDIPPYNHGRAAYENQVFFQNVKNILEACDFLTVTTENLRLYYIANYGIDPDKVLVLPNYLPRWWIGEAYDDGRIEREFLKNSSKPRVAFPMSSSHFDIGGKNGFVDDFTEMCAFIRETHRKYHYMLIGHCPKALEDLARDRKIEILPGSDLLNYPRELSQKNIQAIVAPLLDNTFNKCKCVTGDTRIQVEGRGVVNIEDVCGDEFGKHEMEAEVRCLSLDGKYKRITHYFKSPEKEALKRIITRNGYEISGTPYHKIMTKGEWKEFGDIKRGDKITLQQFNISEDAPYVELRIPCLHTKKLSQEKFQRASNMVNCPTLKVTETFAKLFGYLLGDGWFNGSNSIGIVCCDRDTEVIDEVAELIESFGIESKVKKCDDKKATNVYMHSKSFRMLWESLGFVGSIGRGKGNGKNMRVPDFIWNSRKSVVKNFLMGLFESDAGINETSIVFSAKSKSFVKDVQLLLLSLGIKSKRYNRKSYIGEKCYGDHYYLVLTRQWVDEYYKIFGEECFTSKFKRDKVKVIVSKNHSNAYKSQELLEEEVSSAVMCGEDYVYDVCVEDTHCYVANGIISHNSNIKLLEGWALGIPVIAQDLKCYTPYTDMVFRDNDGLQRQLDKLLGNRRHYMSTVRHCRKVVDYGDDKSPNGWWLEKNLQQWYSLYTLPQKTLMFDLTKKPAAAAPAPPPLTQAPVMEASSGDGVVIHL